MLHNLFCEVVEHKIFLVQRISHKSIDFSTEVWYNNNGDKL